MKEEEEYSEFYKVDAPVIRFEGGVKEILHVQRSLAKIAEEQGGLEQSHQLDRNRMDTR